MDDAPRAPAIDSTGGAHLAFERDGAVVYLEPVGAAEWRASVVVDGINGLGNVSLALDAADQPHLAWAQYIENASVWYAR